MSAASEKPFELLSGRRFSFYPSIRNIEHNEWTLEKDTWSEILAKNVASGQLLWVPRNYLGEISNSDMPVLIVGLKLELAYKAGQLVPYRNPVVELPWSAPMVRRTADGETVAEPSEPSRESSTTETKTLALIGRAIGLSLVGLLALAIFALNGWHNPFERLFRADTSTADQLYLGLTGQDRYHIVVGKLGRPGEEKWLTKDEDELQFQALSYPERRYTVVLMGAFRNEVRYIGTLHEPERSILDSARIAGGGDMSSMMKNLPQF